MGKVLKLLFIVIGSLIAGIVVYFLCAVLFSVITVKAKPADKKNIAVYLITNGVHSDIVVPVKNEIKDWRPEVKYEHTEGRDTTNKFLAFGWGDKGFYLETPTWSDLKFSTAFNATFGLGTSAVHATFFKYLREDEDCVKLYLNATQYQNLVAYIESTFDRDTAGNILHIKTNANYGEDDAFYEAKGRYNLFKTCNTWTNNALKACEQRACFWTPFEAGIFWQYRKSY